MLLKNNKKSGLFYTLLGDYYLYMYSYTNRSDFINNSTSTIIHQLFDEIGTNINASWFLKDNKIIRFGKVKLQEEKIIVFDINGNKIDDVELLYVLNEEQDVFFNISKSTDEVVKLMERLKINETICYFTTNNNYLTTEEAKFMFNIDSADLPKIVSYVIYKLIRFSVTNSKLINNIIAVFFGVPYCVSSKETIETIDDNIIKTDKNEYIKKHSKIFFYNKEVVFGEPLYHISYIKNENNPILTNINKKKMFMDGYSNVVYLKRFQTYVEKTFLNAIIDIDIVIETPYKAASLSKILHSIKYVDTDLNGEKYNNETNEILTEQSFNLIEKDIFNCTEKYVLTTNYYRTANIFQTNKEDKLFLIEKNQSEIIEEKKEDGLVFKNETAKVLLEDLDKKYIEDELSVNEHTTNTGKKIEFVLETLNEDIKNTVSNKDIFVYKQNESLIYYHKKNTSVVTVEDSLLNIVLKKQDSAFLPVDNVFLKTLNSESVKQEENVAKKGKNWYTDSIYSSENNIYKQIEINTALHKDEYKIEHKLDKSLLRIRDDVSSFSRVIKLENMNFKDNNALKNIVNDVLINRDRLDVESDTNIDEA